MPRELRQIFLNTIDLTHAIEGFRTEKPQFLPHGKLSHVEVQPEHLALKIEMKYVDNVHVLDYRVDYDKLVEVVIAFCIDRRIPMPAAGTKTCFAADDEVVLEIILADESANGATPGVWPRLRERIV
jgi:hypothetical protein